MDARLLMNLMMMMAEGDESVSPAYQTVRLILMILVVICSIYIVLVVLLQSGNSQGITAFGGGAETFFSKNKARTIESKRKRRTVGVSILLAIFLIALAVIKIVPF